MTSVLKGSNAIKNVSLVCGQKKVDSSSWKHNLCVKRLEVKTTLRQDFTENQGKYIMILLG